MSYQRRADLTIAIIAAIWGTTFVLVKGALEDCSVILFLALRFTTAAIALILMFGRRVQFDRRQIAGGIFTGVLLIAGYILQTAGLRSVTASESGFLTSFYIVLVPLFSAVVYKNVPGWREWLGVVLAIIGISLMTLDTFQVNASYGALLTLFGAVAFAMHILVLGYWSKRTSTELLSIMQITTGALICWTVLPFAETPSVQWTPRLLLVLGFTGVVATALVFAAQTWAQKHTTSTRTALIFSLEPVFAAITGYLVGGERFTAQAAVGALLILTGILRAELKPSPAHHNL